MKHQNKFNDMLRKFGVFVLTITFVAIHMARAQGPIEPDNYLYTYNPSYPYEYMTSGHYQEVTIPSTTEASYLYLEVKGGDGGYNLNHNGGIGAVTKGMFEIGTGTNQISPGSTLRMIQGQHGRKPLWRFRNNGRVLLVVAEAGAIAPSSGRTNWDASILS
ncbi:MAG: hypothetical protein H6563_07460 [Lewinellaceae bacterium]|nr:hypothetical protein [Lewinellaceae bacterium]